MKVILISMLVAVTMAGEWLTNFSTAKEAASKEHKHILLNFSGSDWCGPCIKMKTEVFGNVGFLSLAEQELILVRADFPRSKKNQLSKEQARHNEELAEKYNPSGKFPLTLLLDANGSVVKVWDGYVSGNQNKFIDELDKTLP